MLKLQIRPLHNRLDLARCYILIIGQYICRIKVTLFAEVILDDLINVKYQEINVLFSALDLRMWDVGCGCVYVCVQGQGQGLWIWVGVCECTCILTVSLTPTHTLTPGRATPV